MKRFARLAFDVGVDAFFIVWVNLRWVFRVAYFLDRRTTVPCVVTLTSYNARFGTLSRTLKSLLLQSAPAEKVVLWVAGEDMVRVPSAVLKLQTERRFEIRTCKDLLSYKKLLPALREFPGMCLVTADDDAYYPSTWLRDLYRNSKLNPKAVVFHRGRIVTFEAGERPVPYSNWPLLKGKARNLEPGVAVPTGLGGILYPPSAISEDLGDYAVASRICPKADDLWFYWCVYKQGIPTRCTGTLGYIHTWRRSQSVALWRTNLGDGQNDACIGNMAAELGAFRNPALNAKVSVLITHYNRPAMLQRAIQSVLKDAALVGEILVVDDGSDEESRAAVRKIAASTRLVRLVELPCNRGANAARNAGIRAAACAYLALLDSDDEWLPGKLAQQLLHLNKHHLDFSATQFVEIAANKTRVLPRRPPVATDLSTYIFLFGGHLQTSTLLVRRSAALDTMFDESLRKFQDWDFVIRLEAGGWRGDVLMKPLTYYHTEHDGRISSRVRPDRAVDFFNRVRPLISAAACFAFHLRTLPLMHLRTGSPVRALASISYAVAVYGRGALGATKFALGHFARGTERP